ncbi:hypothetical protein [Alicyclobacillus fastidiosus]|uniref:hypothetical protein n=1 Tax=Alicyclobacillus fastidiosus TaxID=392011 RepID=UPI0023B7C629|nr:hypothetical protein [Alicyclobacillus fastidiosus]WEH09285.1 hypothetical protein PYS47_21855 [Alicyclobacillus fastidiosus]
MDDIREHNKRFWEADTAFLLSQLDAAKQTIAEKDADIERLQGLLDIVTEDRDAHKRLAQDFALGR